MTNKRQTFESDEALEALLDAEIMIQGRTDSDKPELIEELIREGLAKRQIDRWDNPS